MSIENPYFHRGPIRNPAYFFGRQQEVTSALSLIKNNQSVSIVGPRRIGKTSFLFHIFHPAVMAQYGLPPDEHIFVYIDCGGLSELDQVGFYRLILEETEDQLLAQDLDVRFSIPDPLTYRQFERTLRRLSRQGLKLIYLLDEFEHLSENYSLDADFFSGLRGLTARHNVCYVTASQAHLLELSYAEGVLGSPFFNIFAVQYLGLFSQNEAAQLIHTPAQTAGVEIPAPAAEYLLELVGPHPMFLNVACFHTFAWLSQQRESTAMPADDSRLPAQIEGAILDEVEGHLRYYWGKLDDHEQAALASLGQPGQGETTQVLFHRLEQKGLVIGANGGYRYASRALAELIDQQLMAEGAPAPDRRDSGFISGQVGAYRITEQVGRGGMARVYRGYHEALKRDVAIKTLFGYLADDAEFLGRFQREAQAVAALRHAHIVQVYDFGLFEGLYYMVMEFIDGGSLRDRLDGLEGEAQRMPLPEVVRIMTEVASALDYAHRQGIVHRDLKPSNIMLTGTGQAVLTDFGLARMMSGARHTATGASFGTPAYMSPEQAQGERGDERSDIYALGVILYELATGRPPFTGETPLSIIMQQISEPPPPLRQLDPAFSEPTEQVIKRALAKVPARRYASATDLVQAFTASLSAVDGQSNPQV